MTYHRPLFTENVLKVRLSYVKPSEKIRGKNQGKKSGEKISKKIMNGVEYIPLKSTRI